MKMLLTVGLALIVGANFGFALAARVHEVKAKNYICAAFGFIGLLVFVLFVE